METKLFTEERQDELINLLKERKSVTVQNLSDYFGVSGATIRTDLSVDITVRTGCSRLRRSLRIISGNCLPVRKCDVT